MKIRIKYRDLEMELEFPAPMTSKDAVINAVAEFLKLLEATK